LSHNIIDQSQYSLLVAAVVASAVIPTLIANAYYLPRHLIQKPREEPIQAARSAGDKNPITADER
jgi:hypothetical protein